MRPWSLPWLVAAFRLQQLRSPPCITLLDFLHATHLCTYSPPPPSLPQVYDFMFDKERGKWVPWMEGGGLGAHPELDPEAEFTTIIVPTVDTVR